VSPTPCTCTRFRDCPLAAELRRTAAALGFTAPAVKEWVQHRRAALAALPASASQEPPTPRQRPAVAVSATPAPERPAPGLYCKRGHDLTGPAAVYRHPDGQEECRECRRLAGVRRRERQRAAYRERLEEERARGLGEDR
jgi:hypothetical protein